MTVVINPDGTIGETSTTLRTLAEVKQEIRSLNVEIDHINLTIDRLRDRKTRLQERKLELRDVELLPDPPVVPRP